MRVELQVAQLIKGRVMQRGQGRVVGRQGFASHLQGGVGAAFGVACACSQVFQIVFNGVTKLYDCDFTPASDV